MNVIFRVDASLEIGNGHVIRCLCLAEGLRQNGSNVEFICRQHHGSLVEKIRSSGFKTYELESGKESIVDSKLFHSPWLGVTQQKDADDCIEIIKTTKIDWLIVDHYGIDEDWQMKLKSYCNKIMVIDDLGDRSHYCSLLLDQNIGSTFSKYKELVKKDCKLLIGPNYALLRAEFSQWRDYSLRRRENTTKIMTVLVSMGGVDSGNYTEKILKLLARSKLTVNTLIQVVMGENAMHIKEVKKQAAQMPFRTEVKIGVDNMAEIMAKADLAIGATGSTSWERCCLGLPTMQIVVSENQHQVARALDQIKAIKLLEKLDDIIFNIETFNQWFYDVKKNCKFITDGYGVNLVLEELY